jgi:hypothetical protein
MSRTCCVLAVYVLQVVVYVSNPANLFMASGVMCLASAGPSCRGNRKDTRVCFCYGEDRLVYHVSLGVDSHVSLRVPCAILPIAMKWSTIY